MHDDRVGDLVACLRTGRGPALQTVLGIARSILVGGLCTADALEANRQALVVHHGKHCRQPAVGFAYQVTGGFVEVHHAGGRGLDAHLVFNGAAVRRIARAEAAIGIDQELRYQKQRNALGPGRGVGQLGQDQVDDVFGQVLLAAGDEDLGATDAITAISVGFGFGANDAQIGTGMWFGQAHGAGPLTAVQRRQVGSLEVITGMGVQRQAAPGTQG
ncbi:hypothetical protein D3C79_782210 [compost metagenome]